MTEPAKPLVRTVRITSPRTLTLITVMRHTNEKIGRMIEELSAQGHDVPVTPADVEALMKSVYAEKKDELFGFLKKKADYYEPIAEDGEARWERVYDKPEAVFGDDDPDDPAKLRRLCVATRRVTVETDGIFCDPICEIIAAFDRVINLLEICRITGAMDIYQYHFHVRALDGSTYHALRRFRNKIRERLCLDQKDNH